MTVIKLNISFCLELILLCNFFTANITLKPYQKNMGTTLLLDRNDSTCIEIPQSRNNKYLVGDIHVMTESCKNTTILGFNIKPVGNCDKILLYRPITKDTCSSQMKLYKRIRETVSSLPGDDDCYYSIPLDFDITKNICQFDGYLAMKTETDLKLCSVE